MLVLSRKINQSIIIGDSIEVMVVDIKGDQIKVGILAPKSVKVFRKEVYDDIVRANREAARTGTVELATLSGFIKPGDTSAPKKTDAEK